MNQLDAQFTFNLFQ